MNAVLGGGGRCSVAKLFGVTRQAIHKWMTLYEAGGEKALLAKPRGAPKREGILKPRQCALAVRIITDKCPEQRFGCNMVSAIDNAGHLAFKMFEGKFNGTVFIDFMRRPIRQAGHKVFLIVDNLKAHKSEAVMKWLEKRSSSIRLFFLPKDGPDLNPDEYLNNDAKSNAVGRRRAKDKDDLKANVSAYPRSTQRQPNVGKNFFQERPVQYAAM
ncbi:MAG: transposase [Planctomycetota bacterium]|nr:transposase [Planctomycetota bacterium]